MTNRKQNRTHPELDARAAEVLRSIVVAYIDSGEPVGSVAVSRRSAIDLSPASIRSVMADLERDGYLAQPYTSAGRIPTTAGYRMFVDRLMRAPRVSPSHARKIETALAESRRRLATLLGEASRQLSQFSHQVGVVLAPALPRMIIEQLEFVGLSSRRVVAIIVGRSGTVQHRVLRLEQAQSQDDLDRIGRFLTQRHRGRTLLEMRAALLAELEQERARYDRLRRTGLELGRRAVEPDPESAEAEMFIEGAANLLDNPEFSDLHEMRRLLRTLEEKTGLIELLTRLLDGEGVQVVIGEENPVKELARCAVVTSTYGTQDRVMGTVGIVGPTRIAYPRAIALVGHLAASLSRMMEHERGATR